MKGLANFFGTGERNGGHPVKEIGKRGFLLAGLAVLGVFLIFFPWTGSKSSSSPAETGYEPASARREGMGTVMTREEEQLSKKLCEILKRVEGAGKVEVSVKLSGSTRSEYAFNTTTGKKNIQEQDQSGGTRLTTEGTESGQLVINRRGSSEEPVVQQETAPKVAGVLIVAEGAAQPQVKAKLFEAARVSLGAEPQKIVVLPMGRVEN